MILQCSKISRTIDEIVGRETDTRERSKEKENTSCNEHDPYHCFKGTNDFNLLRSNCSIAQKE